MSDYFFAPDVSKLVAQIQPESIISRTFYADERIKVILFGFDTGQELSEHTAAVPAIIHILQGEATLTLGGESREVGPGAWAHMPPRLPHSVLAKTPLLMLLTLIEMNK